MSIPAEGILDLVTTTLKELGRARFTEIATDIQQFHIWRLIRRRQVSMGAPGVGLQWNLMTRTGGGSRHVGLFAEDVVNVEDVMVTASMPWRHTTQNYAFDLREPDLNSGAAQIVDIVKTRRIAKMLGLAELIEATGWGLPASNDNVTPSGIPLYVVKWPAGNPTPGFTGGNPPGYANGAANLSSTTYPRWSNWAGRYQQATKTDLIAKMRTAARKSDFMSPIKVPTYNSGFSAFELFTNNDLLSELELIGEAQNENLGRDIASMDGQIVFRRNPILYVPYLDADTSDPIYGINWRHMYFGIAKGWFFRESPQLRAGTQHTVVAVHIDTSWQLKCTDRRRSWVLSKLSSTDTAS